MGKCLVTNLKGVVDNNNLLHLGEMRIGFPKYTATNGKARTITIKPKSAITLSIVGSGYFTDATLSQNNGTTASLAAFVDNKLYISNDVVEVSVPDKYNLLHVFISNDSFFDLDTLKYSKALEALDLYSGSSVGDIASLNKLTSLTGITIIGSKGIYGDISSLKNLTSLRGLYIDNCNKITGDCASLEHLTSLRNEVRLVSNNLLMSDLSKFNKWACRAITLNIKDIKGDIAKLPSSCIFTNLISQSNNGATWSERPSSSKIMAMDSNLVLKNVDKMLQDQANCTVGYTSSDPAYYKIIKISGTRTSASDAAVATLQSKGYTVAVIPA